MTAPKLYNELAEWWPLMSAPEDYEEEATFYVARVLETAFLHCRPGGVALFAPDHVRENFKPGTYEIFVCVTRG